MMTKSKLFKNAEKLGWTIEKDEYSTQPSWIFSIYSEAGEDFSFTVANGSGEEMQDEIREYHSDFDAEDHARQNDGVAGAPDLVTLVKDAANIREQLGWLAYSEIHFEREKRSKANKIKDLSPAQVAKKILSVLEKLSLETYYQSLFKKQNGEGLVHGIKDSAIKEISEILSQYKEE